MNTLDIAVVAAFLLVDELRTGFFALLDNLDAVGLMVLLIAVVYLRKVDFSSFSDKFFGSVKLGV